MAKKGGTAAKRVPAAPRRRSGGHTGHPAVLLCNAMPWPPAVVCRRVALVIYSVSLLLYLTLSGLLHTLGLDVRAVLVVAQLVALLGLSMWLARLLRIPAREAFALRPAAPVHWYMVAASALPLQALGGGLQYVVLRRLPEDSQLRQLMEQGMGRFVAVETGLDVAMLFLAAVVIAALCEEMLFRGLILQLIRRRAGWGQAIVWSAALFAIYHLNPIVLLPVTLVGAYLGLLVWRSGSLYPAIAAHALNNGLALFGLPLILDEAVYARWLGVTLASAAAVLGVLLYAYFKLAGPPPVPPAGPSPSAPPAPAGWPGGLEGDRIDGGLGDGEQTEHPQ